MSEARKIKRKAAKKKASTKKPPAPPTSFKDAEGVEWRPVFNTPVLIEACQDLDFTLADLMTLKINIGDLLTCLWFACRKEAEERKVDRESFFERIPLERLPDAMAAFWGKLEAAFPDMPQLGAMKSGPFGLGI